MISPNLGAAVVPPDSPSNLNFPQTRWSLVISASKKAGSALEELCELYWRPVFYYLRRKGLNQHDAEDLTQSYFARLLKSEHFIDAGKVTGRLRYYLLGGVKRHLADHNRAARAKKRGRGIADIPLALSEADLIDADHTYAAHPEDHRTPEQYFDQTWALELLGRVHESVQAQYEASGKALEYDLLKPALASTSDINTPEVSQRLGISPGYLRVLTSRLRRNFRAAMRDEISHTVTSRDEIDDELRQLLEVFS